MTEELKPARAKQIPCRWPACEDDTDCMNGCKPAPVRSPAQGTPASRWREKGEIDPHGTRYDCERASTAGGHLTDDEVANAVFLDPSIQNLTIAKDRIRWLSRKLAEALAEGEPAAVRQALVAINAAHESMFVQCCSNPIKNAWGKDVDVSLLNEAHRLADIALASLRSAAVSDNRHPWYGPCDALGPQGQCAECMKLGRRSPAVKSTQWCPGCSRDVEKACHHFQCPLGPARSQPACDNKEPRG
jgi:hypothetical protein